MEAVANRSESSKTQPLAGKVILVTGGGRGLGKAIGGVLDDAGACVISADLRDGTTALDVGDERQVERVVQDIVQRFGTIDALINNAGVDVTLPIEELSSVDWDRIMRVNLRGPFLLSKQVFPIMRRQGCGQIVNIVSTASKRAWANASAYHASKWGLLGFSHALHVEGRPHGIKVTAVVCGGMQTPFLLDRFPDIDLRNLQDPRNVAETIRFVLTLPTETVIPEMMVLPMRETSWP